MMTSHFALASASILVALSASLSAQEKVIFTQDFDSQSARSPYVGQLNSDQVKNGTWSGLPRDVTFQYGLYNDSPSEFSMDFNLLPGVSGQPKDEAMQAQFHFANNAGGFYVILGHGPIRMFGAPLDEESVRDLNVKVDLKIPVDAMVRISLHPFDIPPAHQKMYENIAIIFPAVAGTGEWQTHTFNVDRDGGPHNQNIVNFVSFLSGEWGVEDPMQKFGVRIEVVQPPAINIWKTGDTIEWDNVKVTLGTSATTSR